MTLYDLRKNIRERMRAEIIDMEKNGNVGQPIGPYVLRAYEEDLKDLENEIVRLESRKKELEKNREFTYQGNPTDEKLEKE